MKIYTITRRAVRRWLLRSLQPCRQMVPLMSQSMERRLGLLEYLELKLHLLVCAWCAEYLKQIRFISRIIGLRRTLASKDDWFTVALTSDARQRIAASLTRISAAQRDAKHNSHHQSCKER